MHPLSPAWKTLGCTVDHTCIKWSVTPLSGIGAFGVRSTSLPMVGCTRSDEPGTAEGKKKVIRDGYPRHLASVPVFSNCTKRQLQEIGKVADELILPVGKVLARQGEVGFEMFILLDGTAEVTRDGQRMATVTAGDVVGELAVLSGHPRNATVTAETELRVLVLTHRGLSQLLDDIPGLAKHMLYEVTSRIVEASTRAQEFDLFIDVNLGFLYFHNL